MNTCMLHKTIFKIKSVINRVLITEFDQRIVFTVNAVYILKKTTKKYAKLKTAL